MSTHSSADQEKEKYLRSQLQEHIEWFDKESAKHKNLFRQLRYLVFGFTACSSALAGLALAFPSVRTAVTVVIVITTAAVGIVTSVEGLRKPNELWIHERTLFYSLKDIERDLNYRMPGSVDCSVIDEIYRQMQDVLGASRDRWSRQVGGHGAASSAYGAEGAA